MWVRVRRLSVDHFADGAAFRDYFKTVYGPTISGRIATSRVTRIGWPRWM
jgi:hypothetical protein